MGREPLLKLTSADTPLDLAEDVEAILEVDRLFWLDPNNKYLKQFERDLIPGEELPKKLPPKATRVLVTRLGRTFIVAGKPVLMIEDNVQLPALPKAKKDHKIGDALNEFRIFMAEFNRQVLVERDRRLALRPSVEARRAQSEADKLRAAERSAAKRAKREATSAAKRSRRNGTSDTTRGNSSV